MEEQYKHQTFKFGGCEHTSLTPLEAAQRFASLYLPEDLTSMRIKVPKEKIDYGLSTQIPVMSEDEWKTRAEKIQDKSEKESFQKYWSQFQGGASELCVWNYISKIPDSITLGLFHNFDLRMFRLFTGAF